MVVDYTISREKLSHASVTTSYRKRKWRFADGIKQELLEVVK